MTRIFILVFCLHSIVSAHVGHGHGAAPVASSTTKLGGEASADNPLSISFKIRAGNEFGEYYSTHPGLGAYFGNDEVNLNINYEFQLRQFSSGPQSEYADRDYKNFLNTTVKKTLSPEITFSLAGDYEKNQAVQLARMINDYDFIGVRTSLAYKMKNEWTFNINYLMSSRQYPNGTYLVPSSAPSGAGEPITPGQANPANEAISPQGVTDNQNEAAMSIGGDIGSQTMNFEGRYVVNDSDLTSRRYNSQVLRVALEKMLWSRIFVQLSYSIENRVFSERSDKINITEFGLQKELSARVSIAGILRNYQTEAASSSSTSEGYAQLQYAF